MMRADGTTNARRGKVAFAGNCQALALADVYARHIAPLRDEVVIGVDLHPDLSAANTAARLEQLRDADVLVEQKFDSSSPIPHGFLGAGARRILFPYVGGAFLWPFAMEPHALDAGKAQNGLEEAYPGEIGDRVLNGMIRDGVTPDEALRRYLEMDVVSIGHVDRLMELHLDRQRQRDAAAGIPIADVIESRFRGERLFLTTGHPTLALFKIVAEQVFSRMGVPYSLTEHALRSRRVAPFPRDEAPIHPAVAAHWRLSFATADQRYRFRCEGAFTFAEYVLRYMTHAWDAELTEGISLANRGENERPRALLLAALARCPGSAEGWRALAFVQSRSGRLDEAHDAAARATALDPDDPEGPCARAHVWMGEGKLAEAERCARQAIDLAPLAPEAHRLLAHIAAVRGDFQGAIQASRFAMRLAPGDPAGMRILAEHLMRDGRRAEALDLAWMAVETEPRHAHSHACLGRALLELEPPDLSAAISAFRRAVVLEPTVAAFRDALADALIQAGRKVESAEARAGRGGDPNAHAWHAELLMGTGRLADAETSIRLAIEGDPSHLDHRTMLSAILERRGKTADAFNVVRDLLKTAQSDPRLHARHGALLTIRGDLEGAEAALSQALELDPSNTNFHQALRDIRKRLGRGLGNEGGYRIDFADPGLGREMLLSGWSHAEPHHTWTLGTESVIAFPGPIMNVDYILCVVAFPGGMERDLPQHASFRMNGHVVAQIDFRSKMDIELTIPKSVLSGQVGATLDILLPNAFSPAELGISGDTRRIALAFESLEFRPSRPSQEFP